MRKVGSALDDPYLCKAKTEIWRRMVIDDKIASRFRFARTDLSEGKQALALGATRAGPSLDRILRPRMCASKALPDF